MQCTIAYYVAKANVLCTVRIINVRIAYFLYHRESISSKLF